MAIYEYQCSNCGYITEKLDSFNDREESFDDMCENCGEDVEFKIIISRGSFIIN